ncbi:MAG: multiheme c-type cytochrome [Kofleriaceae bacterium]
MRYRPALAITAAAGVVAAGAGGASLLVGSRSGAPVPIEEALAFPRPEPPAALFTAHGGPVTPGELPEGLSGTAPGDCAPCHAEIAAEWAGSAHARSWTDPIFQAEYQLSREAFCRRCHAPLLPEAPGLATADSTDASPEALAARGIDCAVCHVRAGHVLGVHGRGAGEHAAMRDARLATGAFCGGCHQFDFRAAEPGERLRYHPGQPLQDTLAEWSRSSYADQPCQHCHMPLAGPPGRQHRSHAFRTLDDPDVMARAVRVTARAERRGGTIRATFELAPGEIGHGFPTGDMFRRAVLTVSAGAARRRKVLRRYFAQTVTPDGRGHLLGQVDDTRVPPPGAGPSPRFDFELDDPRAAEVTWSLELFRLDPDEARRRGLDVAALGIPVRSGQIAVTSPARSE